MKKIGIFGGTFDPVHLGHILCVKHLLNLHFLDEILILPSQNPPHKKQSDLTPFLHRVAMLKIAFQSYKKIDISLLEQDPLKTHYSIDTLNKLKKENLKNSYYFILGEDNLQNIHTWKKYHLFILENNFILIRRGGHCFQFNDCPHLTKEEFSKLTQNKIETPLIPISSTLIRNWLKKRDSKASESLSKEVFQYIHDHQLYDDPKTIKCST